MDWLVTGPLVFSARLSQPVNGTTYRAGDSLGFIDPFTGSGILNAMLTGELAGLAAARGVPAKQHLRDCSRLLRRPFLVSSAFRAIIASGQAGWLAPLVPARLLFHATRPAGLQG
jgi:flavin-dependent dehydrogenase